MPKRTLQRPTGAALVVWAALCLPYALAQDEMTQALAAMEEACGMSYRGTMDENDHGRFYCMRAYLAQCQIRMSAETGTAEAAEAAEVERSSLRQMCALVPACPHC